MTTNYFTPIAAGAPDTAATFNAPFGELDAAITGILSGGTGFTQINLGTETALTIASGAITRTRNRHFIDTEAAASQDDLTTINGGVDGMLLMLEIVNAARVVDVLVSGNIRTQSDATVRLDNVNRVMFLVYDGANWLEVGAGVPLKGSNYNNFLIGANQLALSPHPKARKRWGFKASAATVVAEGMAAPTLLGAAAVAANDTDSTYVTNQSGALAGNSGGYVSPTFNLTRRGYNPSFDCVIRPISTTILRIYIGLFSAAAPNADVLGAVSGIGFRYSTVAGDAGWVGVTSDGTTQQVTAKIADFATATRFLLSFEVSPAGVVTFRINNVAQAQLSANLPAAATDLGYFMGAITAENVLKQIKFSILYCDHD